MKDSDKIIDQDLVEQCLHGDKQAFRLLVKRWHQKLCHQAFWYTKDKQLSKDIVQESWIKIFQNLEALKDPRSFGSWALSIVNNKAIDGFRRKAKKEIDENAYLRNSITDNLGDVFISEDSVTSESRLNVIEELNQLPPNQKMVLRLFYVENHSLNEISQLLKISKGTVKSRLFYAREKLKIKFKNRNHEK